MLKTYKDIYKLPLVKSYGRVYDSARNFVFQFLVHDNATEELLLNVINDKKNLTNKDLKFAHEAGVIIAMENDNKQPSILIRGWGNLTGVGGHHLNSDDAANIQDTFAEYIVERLNKREFK